MTNSNLNYKWQGWVQKLHLKTIVLVAIILLIGWIIFSKESSLSIKPSDVWNPSGDEWIGKWQECKDYNCISDLMKSNNASSGSINLVKLLSDGTMYSYLEDFKEMGKVDLGTVYSPDMANSNETYNLLNGNPVLVDTFVGENSLTIDGGRLGDVIKNAQLYQEMKGKYSEVMIWLVAKDFIGKKTLSNKNEEYIFKYDFVDGCHTCHTEYSANIGFVFRPDGKYIGLDFIKIDKNSTNQNN